VPVLAGFAGERAPPRGGLAHEATGVELAHERLRSVEHERALGAVRALDGIALHRIAVVDEHRGHGLAVRAAARLGHRHVEVIAADVAREAHASDEHARHHRVADLER
jgi:hypothetical protein